MKRLFYVYIIIYFAFLILYASFLDIGNFEVSYFYKPYIYSYVENSFFYLFGRSDLILRLPSIILSFFSIILYYKVSQKFLKKQNDIYFSVFLFSLMPGFIMASLLFNKSIYLIFCVLLFLYLFLYHRFYSYIVLLLYTILDKSFISLYLALIFYSIYKKDGKFLFYSIFLFMLNANYFDYKISGLPRGYFVDVLFVYFAIFSPFVFIYFIYTLLKRAKNPTILWFISVFALFFSILLSFRQRIKIDDYAPFVVISVVFMSAVFLSDYRVRLKIFRKNYRILFVVLFSSLIVFDILMLLGPYFFTNKIFTQFRHSRHVALFLKKHKINYVYCNNKDFCNKLYFYGIKKGNKYYIKYNKTTQKVSISHIR